MVSTKQVLPNFAKSLMIALFTVGSVSVYADDHAAAAEEAIGEYNEVKAEAMEVEEAVSELTDSEAALDEATDEAMDAAAELKSEAKSLAEE